MARFNDLTGEIFGNLKVIKRDKDYISPSGKKYVKYLCLCNCGNKVIISSSNLTRKNNATKSCGCLQIKSVKKYKQNIYDLSGEYGIGYTTKGEQFYFDLEDYEKIKMYHWYKEKDGYIRASNKDKIYLHVSITNCPNEKYVDHINHLKFDNRKSNLRIVSVSQNAMNRKLHENNTSGVTGVLWIKNQRLWRAEIKINNKSIYLGNFDNFEKAVKARKEAEEKYFGEYSYDNSMKEDNFNENITTRIKKNNGKRKL